MFYRT